MKFSENWLRELIPVPADRAELARRLTMAGLEVETVEALGDGLDGVRVAQILDAQPHPDADRLKVCRVDAGGETLQIVCGAPNARVGLKAPLATVGAVLPGGIAIKAARLRGVESNGMLCSARELGLDADASGLFELPADAPVGAALADYLDLPDATFELKLTPNRSDCLGLRGLAHEVAAEFGGAPTLPPVMPVAPARADALPLRVDAPADCPRYCGRLIRGVDAGVPSPLWMQERLRRAGLRPISALVDVTNYVMLETGQPLHAFDAATLDGGIVVRRARDGETLRLLDEREVALDGGFLVIADEKAALAVAGVMGGHASRVTEATRDVFLESAHFAPSAITGRARRLGLHTDASHRFERGVDPELPRLAIERATALLLQIAGGSAGPVVEAVSTDHLRARAPVRLRRARIERVLGIAVADAEVVRILVALGMRVEASADGWSVTPPSARFDIAIEEDLIEEVARIFGYDAIPAQAPRGELRIGVEREDRIADARLRDQLAARGYLESITYAFVGADLLATWGLGDGAIALANPLSADLAVMRTSLLPGLVAALGTNRNRQQTRLRLFETGRRYRRGADGAPQETACIAAAVLGPVVAPQWGEPARAVDFHDVKGDVESLLALAGADAADVRFEPGGPAWLHPGRAATLRRDGAVVGHVGALEPRLLKALDFDEDVYVFELDLDAVARRRVPVAGELSRYPSLRRDIAVVVPEAITWAQIETVVREAVGPTLVDWFVFDRYAGPNLGQGLKSLAIGLILQDRSRTLVDEDADRCVALAVAAIESGCDGRLRGQ